MNSQFFSRFSAIRRVVSAPCFFISLLHGLSACAQTSKVIVAYTSATSTFTGGWFAKLEGLFRKYNLDVELVLMQGPSTYLPALLSNNIQILYGGGTAVSRTMASGDAPIVVIGTETPLCAPATDGAALGQISRRSQRQEDWCK